MVQSNLFNDNLSIIDNISLYKIDFLIAKYIDKLDVYIYRYTNGKTDKEFCKPVCRTTKPIKVPKFKYTSYVRKLKPFDASKWQEVKRYTTIPAYALELASRSYTLYLTLESDNVISTIWNKYQISGRFSEVVAQTVLIMHLCENNINLKTEPLDEMFKEYTELP